MKALKLFLNILFCFVFASPVIFADNEALQSALQPPLIEDSLNSIDLMPPNEVSYWKEFSRMMMILGVILGVVLLIAWLLRGFLNKRIRHMNQSNIIKLIERRNLSQKSMIYLIEVYDKQYLVGDSAQGGVSLVTECEPSAEQIEPAEDIEKTAKMSFMDILQRKLKQKNFKPQLFRK